MGTLGSASCTVRWPAGYRARRANCVLKVAGALLARLAQARHSKDMDVYFAEQSAGRHHLGAALALSRDLGDLSGSVTSIAPLQEEPKGSRVHVPARS